VGAGKKNKEHKKDSTLHQPPPSFVFGMGKMCTTLPIRMRGCLHN